MRKSRKFLLAPIDDPRFQPESDAILAVYAPGFQYYADQYAAGAVVEEATVEALERVIGDDRSAPVVWLLTARGTNPSDVFMDVLRTRFERTDNVGFLSTRVRRWEPVFGVAPRE